MTKAPRSPSAKGGGKPLRLDKAPVLVTGAAGFIGAAVSRAILAQGGTVIGIDNMNAYYDAALKRDRLARLQEQPGFRFHRVDVADLGALRGIEGIEEVSVVIHLAAQAGVRYSIENPMAFGQSNLVGHLTILELCRRLPGLLRLVYASSSSVYGSNAKTPFTEDDAVDHPVSLYAATKRASELMSESYAALYGLPQIGLRFFTVYGPWGRPDMAYWTFTHDILEGRAIALFNHGDMKRDFTYIDDIVAGVLSVVSQPPRFVRPVPHRIYNIGNSVPVQLARFIEIIEKATGRRAVTEMRPMQAGDVKATYAGIDRLAADYGYRPVTSLEAGMGKFVAWFAERYGYAIDAHADAARR